MANLEKNSSVFLLEDEIATSNFCMGILAVHTHNRFSYTLENTNILSSHDDTEE